MIYAALLAFTNVQEIPADTQPDLVGDWLCTVAEKAGIASTHLEDAPAPKAYVNHEQPTRFKIRVALSAKNNRQLRIDELPYSGPDRDPREYDTEFSVLHDSYYGEDGYFASKERWGHFNLRKTARNDGDGDYGFYHSGFEYPGREDTELAVRWGRCKRL